MVQKIYSKMYLVSFTNTYRDVTDLVNHGMVKNTKTWISWKQNIIFLQNKKILNLCLKWHILRGYRFLAELTVGRLATQEATRILLIITFVSLVVKGKIAQPSKRWLKKKMMNMIAGWQTFCLWFSNCRCLRFMEILIC